MQLKILKFTLNFKSLVNYMFQPIWSSSLALQLTTGNAALLSTYKIPNVTPFYAPMCYTFVVLGDFVCMLCAVYTLIAVKQCLTPLSKHPMMTISAEKYSAPVI
jgi:hypothetical protein